MGKKLQITAKIINNQGRGVGETMPSQKLEYQWHWARIFSVLLMCMVLPVSAAIYFYPSDITAAENTQAIGAHTEHKIVYLKSNSQELQADDSLDAQPEVTVDITAQKKSELSEIETGTLLQDPIAEAPSSEIEASSKTETNSAIETNKKSEEKEQTSTLYDAAMGVKLDAQYVSRALLTRDISAREPVDVINERIARSSFTKKLFFFTEVHGLNNQTVHHKWYFNDQLQADVALSIYSSRYRTYSSKNISALQQGVWRVELVAGEKILASKQFTVTGR